MKKLICVVVILTTLGLSTKAEEVKQRQVTVTGKSSIKVDPDKATMRFAIINKEKDAEKARQRNELTAKKVLNSVRELGIDEKQMQLESMQITEEKKYDSKTRTYNFDGYKATRVFVVELYNLELLAGVIAAVVSSGSNELSNVEYGLQDPDVMKKQALKNAMVNAMEKTDLILAPLENKRGELITVDELSNDFINYPRPNYKSVRVMAMAADASVAEEDAFAQGQIEVEASIRAVFSIQK